MEADLLRFFHVDLLDYWRTPRTLSTRRLLNLVDRIPHGQGAALYTLDGPEWTAELDIADNHRRWFVASVAKDNEDPGPHKAHPSHHDTSLAPSAEVVAYAARLRDEREAAIAAGEIT